VKHAHKEEAISEDKSQEYRAAESRFGGDFAAQFIFDHDVAVRYKKKESALGTRADEKSC